ncbi:hypothetical protein [Amycolatopsis sp. NPDC051372]|uniref:hypothetical protein n=1 Tax=Amycolatopsis sp. NPDC051372 TaxID=3155669 RepID=UPI003438128A
MVDETVFQTLSLVGADRCAWEVSPAAGCRLHAWQGSAPEELVASYAEARRAIADSPFGRSANRFPRWTADCVRESEADRRRRGIDHRVVTVVQRDSPYMVDVNVALGYRTTRETVILAHDLEKLARCRAQRSVARGWWGS